LEISDFVEPEERTAFVERTSWKLVLLSSSIHDEKLDLKVWVKPLWKTHRKKKKKKRANQMKPMEHWTLL
jgi:hypothetical protein